MTANALIHHFFSSLNVLISRPVIMESTHSTLIYIFYYMPEKTLNHNTVNNLGEELSYLLKRPVELRLIKQYYPYLNSDILAQYIGINTRQYSLVQILRRLFSAVAPVKNIENIELKLPSYIIGLKVQVSGRLITERTRPRQTKQEAELGNFSKGTIDYGWTTIKNKKGVFTVKV